MRRNRVISCRRPRQSKTNKLILKLKDLVILIRYVKVLEGNTAESAVKWKVRVPRRQERSGAVEEGAGLVPGEDV
jgi:hypothetical protein